MSLDGGVAPLVSPTRIVGLRGARPAHHPFEIQDVALEQERTGGALRWAGTLFLTGAECPFRCVFCDLWQHTLGAEATPPRALPRQIDQGLELLNGRLCEVADGPDDLRDGILKLYNASNFFEQRAVPEEDDPAMLERCAAAGRVVVECHPSVLLSRSGRRRAERWAGGADLEIALGLETCAPGGPRALGKGADLDDFAEAFELALSLGARVRAFVLYGIPTAVADGHRPGVQRSWTLGTLRWARERGASSAAVIPVRGGNGALEELGRRGRWRAPELEEVASAYTAGLDLERPGFDVHLDTWSLAGLRARDPDGAVALRQRLVELNLRGRDALCSQPLPLRGRPSG